jgi:type I restriction enzyme, S subunit
MPVERVMMVNVSDAEEHAVSQEGDLPNGWIRATLADVCEVERGITFPASVKGNSESEGRIACLRTANIQSTTDWDDLIYIPLSYVKNVSKLLRPHDILISMANSRELVGKVSYIDQTPVESTFGGFIAAIRVLEPIDSRFLFYFLRADSTQERLRHSASQTVNIANLSLGAIYSTPVTIPPIAEQRRIVAEIEKLFTQLDAGVAALKRAQTNLARYKAAVLKAACEGKLVPQDPNDEPASRLLERILAERRAKWEADLRARGKDPAKVKYEEPAPPDTEGLPELPKGWVWTPVEAVSTKVVDGVHKKPDYVDSGIPFVTVRNLTAGPGISFEKLNYVTEDDHKEFCKRANPERGDILISKDGTLGVVREITTDVEFSIFVSVALIKPVTYRLSNYLCIALSSPQVQAQMVPKGSGLQHIHLEDLRVDCIPLPPLAEQRRVVKEVQRRLSLIHKLEVTVRANMKRAERLQQAILKRAFEGKLVPQDPSDEPAYRLLARVTNYEDLETQNRQHLHVDKQEAPEQLRLQGI